MEIISILDKIKILHENNNNLNKIKTKLDNDIFISVLHKMRTYTTILGPVALLVYKINNKLIFLFADSHEQPKDICYTKCDTDKCKWIHEFLYDLFTTSPICIDFFHETVNFLQIPKTVLKENQPALKESIDIMKIGHDIGLHTTTAQYADCFSPIKTNCGKFRKTRFHNIEFRRFIPNIYNIHNYHQLQSIFGIPIAYMYKDFDKGEFNMGNVGNGYTENDIDQQKSIVRLKNYINQLSLHEFILNNLFNGNMTLLSENITTLFRDFDDEHNLIIRQYLGNNNWKLWFTPENLQTKSPYPKIHKQIVNLPDPIKKLVQKHIIKQYTETCQKRIDIIQNKIKKINDKNINKYVDELNDIIVKLKELNLYFGVVLFDLYTIARILKSILIYPDSSLIITYAGSGHINSYTRLFEKLPKAKKIASVGICNKKQCFACIDITNQSKEWNNIIDLIEKMFHEKGEQDCAIKTGVELTF